MCFLLFLAPSGGSNNSEHFLAFTKPDLTRNKHDTTKKKRDVV